MTIDDQLNKIAQDQANAMARADNLSHEVGGNITQYIAKDEAQALIDYADSVYVGFGAPDTVPAGKVALRTSSASSPACSLPSTLETMCITCE